MSHNPNPFDFVPFDENGPQLKSFEKWMSYGPLRSGRITVEMKTLTPVHIVGEQTITGNNIEKSFFYQRNGKHYIPGSSIQGVLRAFIEAACNGWASQLTPYYEIDKEKRTYGFKVIDKETPEKAKITDFLSDKLTIDQRFCTTPSAEQAIDLASFLFGYIPGKPIDKDQFNPALKSHVMIDDAEIAESHLSFGRNANLHEVPDLNDQNAFMGGPHPSASSWWYHHPYAIIKDEITTNNNQLVTTYNFIGSGFRGRKFYFHQDPKKSIKEYNNILKWNLLNFFPIQCIEKGKSIIINIFFSNIPEQLLHLLIFALEPGRYIRHKIGYGKAYGYGSIEFSIQEIYFQGKGFDEEAEIINANILRSEIHKEVITINKEEKNGVAYFLHQPSLDKLSLILWYDESLGYTFTYPCSGNDGFNVSLQDEERIEHNRKLRRAIINTLIKHKLPQDGKGTIKISMTQGKMIATDIKDTKPTLHFEVYQETSEDSKQQKIYNILKKSRSFKYQ